MEGNNTEGSEMDIEVQTELVAGLAVKVVRGDDYDRIQVDGKTIAYVVPAKRAGGIKLDFPTPLVEGAPARFQKMFGGTDGERFTNGRARMLVTGKNVKGARSLIEWVAKASS